MLFEDVRNGKGKASAFAHHLVLCGVRKQSLTLHHRGLDHQLPDCLGLNVASFRAGGVGKLRSTQTRLQKAGRRSSSAACLRATELTRVLFGDERIVASRRLREQESALRTTIE